MAKTGKTEIQNLVNQLHGKPVLIDSIINLKTVPSLVDLGCTIYPVFSKNLVKELNLPRSKVAPKQLRLAKNSEEMAATRVCEICWAEIDLDRKKDKICGHVIDGLAHDLILGEPWIMFNDVVYRAREQTLLPENYGHYLRTHSLPAANMKITTIKYTEFAAHIKKASQENEFKDVKENVLVFAASIHDIN